ncbi:hypothetical protein KJ751_02435 [Patescibacteria group bacterium]|nr:hypothetical protein [Patescibacteria group bacterium]
MTKKKIIILISSALGLILIGVILSFVLADKGEKKEGSEDEGFFSSFFGSGSSPAVVSPVDPLENIEQKYETTTQQEKDLVHLTNFAVAGAIFNEELEKIIYFEKATGHLYKIDPSGQNREQISITTIPGLFEIIWSPDGTKAVLRYFDINSDTIKENVYSFSVSSFATSTEGVFLPINTTSISSSPNNDKIFYLVGENETKGIISSFENKNQKEIFSLFFGEFLTNWPQTNSITLLTKPSYSTEGYFYKLNATNGSLTKLIGDKKGLTAVLSPSTNKILYSQSADNSIETKIYDTDKSDSVYFDKTTLPEKCLFSKIDNSVIYCAVPREILSAKYPDDWYKGLISFSDTIWKIDIDSGINELILNEEDLDAINMSSGKEENFLIFQNKKDGTLWSLKLESKD